MRRSKWLEAPLREYVLIVLLVGAFAADLAFGYRVVLMSVAAIAVLPTFWSAFAGLRSRRITIDVFNTFAVIVSFVTGEARSAGFIALMLAFARLLDWRTEARTRDAVEELMRLKPQKALVERGGKIEEIEADAVKVGDIVVVESGGRVPIDGIIIRGTAHLNEATVTGESVPIEKLAGDRVIAATLVEDGALKVRATGVGKDSTLVRMAELMREASARKSRSEKLADRFAGIFLPLVALLGAGVYIVTRNLQMTAALFLIACADDMAVAIPLAMTASLGQAAKRGVIVKGGASFDILARMRTLVLDKTGTLTYGHLSVREARIAPGVDEKRFWESVAVAEKYSEHPVGRAAYREAVKHGGEAPDADEFRVHKGSGVWARLGKDEIAVGTERLFAELKLNPPSPVAGALGTVFWIAVNGEVLGSIEVSDVPRPEAAESLHRLRALGVKRIIMFTGDNQRVAAEIARTLSIEEVRAEMTPETKLRALEELLKDGPVGMVGDGVNDAPALARADVGIAMGGGGAAVTASAADVILMTDAISRLPEMVELSRRTMSVIRGDTVIWVLSNLAGFALVLTGIAGPAFAAFYNFATDFFPLMNSSRLFRSAKKKSLVERVKSI